MSSLNKNNVTVHWFRHGLRLHDNPALLEAINKSDEFYPVFIFDGESAGTKLIGYNRMRYLLESISDLDAQLRSFGGQLYVLQGSPVKFIERLWEERALNKLCFEQDCEPIWQERDNAVKLCCAERGIHCIEKVSHTLWDPQLVIKTNGGSPPLTFQSYCETASIIGNPPRPVNSPDWKNVKFAKLPEKLALEFKMLLKIPTPEYFGLIPSPIYQMIRWVGGERQALKQLTERLSHEGDAFKKGILIPNQCLPDLTGPPRSLSAALKFGCLSVRRLYWELQDLFDSIYQGNPSSGFHVTSQLIWREYFYTMSVNNPYYGEMKNNPICLDIPWNENETLLNKWKLGKTGYPFIDAAMRQLNQEGWIHHVARNAVASFLTRGVLWQSWEQGLQHFLEKLIDADWSVSAGNWMWVSSSAFEQLLDCSQCVCPTTYGRRLDPFGIYIKRYIPELRNIPVEYIYEPWKAPIGIQEKAGCIIGKNYPTRIIDHAVASLRNRKYMQNIRDNLLDNQPDHCCPSNADEVRSFMWLTEQLNTNLYFNA